MDLWNRMPVSLHLDPIPVGQETMTRCKLVHPLQHCAWRRNKAEAQEQVECLPVHLARDRWVHEQRLELGYPRKPHAIIKKIQGFYTKVVARKEEPLALSIPYCKPEHAIEVREAVIAPLLVPVYNDLG